MKIADSPDERRMAHERQLATERLAFEERMAEQKFRLEQEQLEDRRKIETLHWKRNIWATSALGLLTASIGAFATLFAAYGKNPGGTGNIAEKIFRGAQYSYKAVSGSVPVCGGLDEKVWGVSVISVNTFTTGSDKGYNIELRFKNGGPVPVYLSWRDQPSLTDDASNRLTGLATTLVRNGAFSAPTEFRPGVSVPVDFVFTGAAASGTKVSFFTNLSMATAIDGRIPLGQPFTFACSELPVNSLSHR